MNLSDQAAHLRGIAKHAPEALDADDVRALCNRVVDFLALFADCDHVSIESGRDSYSFRLVLNVDSMAALETFTTALWA